MPIIFNIQRFSTHDGPGIRTTVFFKGCPLRCAWCHNPESQAFAPELMVDEGRCHRCGLCVEACPERAIVVDAGGRVLTDRNACTACGACVDSCPDGCREIAGERAPGADELARRLCADRMFFERSGGGVTLSGGECMAQDIDYIEALCRALGDEGVQVAVDTCGEASRERFARLLPYVDLWLFDLKALDDEVHRAFTGASNAEILANLDFLARSGARINVRIPVVEPVNADEASMSEVADFLADHIGFVSVSLLPYHTTGNGKYRRLGLRARTEGFAPPSDGHMERLRRLFIDRGFADVRIGG